MEDKIDRFGTCPNCGISWDAGDILQSLSTMSCHSSKTAAELEGLAAQYGWTPLNKAHFSSLISHELEDGRHLLECPKMTCQHVFDRYTGDEYRSMFDVRNDSPIVKKNIGVFVEDPILKPAKMEKDLEDHFKVCDFCQQKFDMRDLAQVFEHEHKQLDRPVSNVGTQVHDLLGLKQNKT